MVSKQYETRMDPRTASPCDDERMADLTDCYNWPDQEGCEEATSVEWSPEERAIAQALTDCYNC